MLSYRKMFLVFFVSAYQVFDTISCLQVQIKNYRRPLLLIDTPSHYLPCFARSLNCSAWSLNCYRRPLLLIYTPSHYLPCFARLPDAYHKTNGDTTRILRLLAAYQRVRKELKIWDDFERLHEEASEFSLIRRLLLGGDSIV